MTPMTSSNAEGPGVPRAEFERAYADVQELVTEAGNAYACMQSISTRLEKAQQRLQTACPHA